MWGHIVSSSFSLALCPHQIIDATNLLPGIARNLADRSNNPAGIPSQQGIKRTEPPPPSSAIEPDLTIVDSVGEKGEYWNAAWWSCCDAAPRASDSSSLVTLVLRLDTPNRFGASTGRIDYHRAK
jgi:hypothetical protein